MEFGCWTILDDLLYAWMVHLHYHRERPKDTIQNEIWLLLLGL